MAVTKRIKQGFLRLPMTKKAILLSSAALMLSAVLPWYDNRNSFGVGETYLGIQGPLFLVGYLALAFGAVIFFNMFFPLMGRNFFKLKRKSGMVSMVLGMQTLFLLLVANSVFYHPEFSANVSHKGLRFGMFVSFVSLAILVTAGLLTHRKEKNGEHEDDIEDIMTNAEPVETPVSTPQYSHAASTRPLYSPTQTSRPTSPYSRPEGAYQGDPLQLDAKTRYKMMKSQARRQEAAQSNLWGKSGSTNVTDNMRIRPDL